MITNSCINTFTQNTCLAHNSRQNSSLCFKGKNKLVSPTNLSLQASIGEENLELLDSIRRMAKDKEIYLFGGGVRDCLLGKTPHDLDILVNGDALEFTQQLNRENPELFIGYKLKPEVKRAVVKTKKMSIDVNPLVKGGGLARNKDEIRKAIETKSKSCDFTMNSMIIRIGEDKEGRLKLKLFDKLGVKKDLKNNILRGISNDAFEQNPVNVLRALRFKMKYGMKITPETEEILMKNAKAPVNKGNHYYYRLYRELNRMFRESKNKFECFGLAVKHRIFSMLLK